MSECFLKLTDSENKEVRIQLNDPSVIFKNKNGYDYIKENIKIGTEVFIDGKLHTFNGYECNKIHYSILPKEYRRASTVKRTRPSPKIYPSKFPPITQSNDLFKRDLSSERNHISPPNLALTRGSKSPPKLALTRGSTSPQNKAALTRRNKSPLSMLGLTRKGNKSPLSILGLTRKGNKSPLKYIPPLTNPQVRINEPLHKAFNEQNPSINEPESFFSILEKDLTIGWGKLKVAISNRQQVTVIAAWAIREKESKFKILAKLNECTSEIKKLKKKLIELYIGLDEMFTEDVIKPYIDILSHTLENNYIISLGDIELMPKCIELLELIYLNYENKETDFNKVDLPIIVESMPQEEKNTINKQRNRLISTMLRDINNMSKKYNKEIYAIKEDNMSELFSIMKARLNGNMAEPTKNTTLQTRKFKNNLRANEAKRVANEAKRVENEAKRRENEEKEKAHTEKKEKFAKKLLKPKY